MTRRLGALLAVLALTGCASVVRNVRVRDDWASVDRDRVKRLVIVTSPLPDGSEPVGRMWSTLAARHVDLKREFIIKGMEIAPAVDGPEAPFDPMSRCQLEVDGEPQQVDGVLWLRPDVQQKAEGAGVEAALEGRLLRCVDGEEVWSAQAAGSWSAKDKKLEETVADYVREFGAEVEPYVVGSWYLLRAALDTLPEPELTGDEQMEKIEHAP